MKSVDNLKSFMTGVLVGNRVDEITQLLVLEFFDKHLSELIKEVTLRERNRAWKIVQEHADQLMNADNYLHSRLVEQAGDAILKGE